MISDIHRTPKLPVSFAAIAAFSFVFVIPDTHLPVSKCCNCADGQLNCFLHSASATHLMSLSGLCRTDIRCCPSAPRFLKVLRTSCNSFAHCPPLVVFVSSSSSSSSSCCPPSAYLATTKMICECPFNFEIALAVAAPELCRGRWRHRWDGGVRLHV
jgi:hypothetical protein